MSTGNKNQSIPSAELKLLLFMEVDSMSQMNEKYVSRNWQEHPISQNFLLHICR